MSFDSVHAEDRGVSCPNARKTCKGFSTQIVGALRDDAERFGQAWRRQAIEYRAEVSVVARSSTSGTVREAPAKRLVVAVTRLAPRATTPV